MCGYLFLETEDMFTSNKFTRLNLQKKLGKNKKYTGGGVKFHPKIKMHCLCMHGEEVEAPIALRGGKNLNSCGQVASGGKSHPKQ